MHWIQALYRVAVLLYMCYRSYLHGSLTGPGIFAAFLTGAVHSVPATSLCLNLVVVFFVLGNIATKYRSAEKLLMTKSLVAAGGHSQRSHIQVLANSATASMFILAGTMFPHSPVWLVGVCICYSVATSDTFSSEFGILSTRQPILIVTLRPVPRGTNGGVSADGLAAGLLGSFIVSLVSVAVLGDSLKQKLFYLCYISLFGVVGSLVDSVLGATVQKTYSEKGVVIENHNGVRVTKHEGLDSVSGWNLLDNNGVNFVSISITSGLGVALLQLL